MFLLRDGVAIFYLVTQYRRRPESTHDALVSLFLLFHAMKTKLTIVYYCFATLTALSSFSLRAQVPFTEGFESGDFIEGGWNVSGNIQIDTDGPAAGDYCARAEGGYGFNRVFADSMLDVITLEFSVKVYQTNTTSLIFRIKDGTHITARTGLGVIFRNTGDLIGLDGTTQIRLLRYETERWYHFKLVMRPRDHNYDLYLDGVLKGDRYHMYADDFAYPALFTWSSVEQTGIVFLDEIKLYGGDGSVHTQGPFSSERIAVYPNPASDFLRVEVPAGIKEKWSCALVNPLGQTVFEQPLDNNNQIALPALPKGLYGLCIREGAVVVENRLIVIQ